MSRVGGERKMRVRHAMGRYAEAASSEEEKIVHKEMLQA